MAAPGTGSKVVAPPRGAPDALLAHRRDPDRRSGLLHGRRRHAHIGEVVIFAVMAESFACKASLDDGQPFEHAAETLAEWHPEGVEFLGRRPDPDRQIDAPARNVVEYREVLGGTHRVVQRQQQHVSANADALSARRHRRQERDRRRAPRVGREMVLARPYRIEAELFGQDRFIKEVAVDLVHRLRASRELANSHADDELHAASPIAPIRVWHGSPISRRSERDGGGRGNTTFLLRAFHEAGVPGTLLGVFYDPPFADEAHCRGIGASFEARFNRSENTSFSEAYTGPATVV